MLQTASKITMAIQIQEPPKIILEKIKFQEVNKKICRLIKNEIYITCPKSSLSLLVFLFIPFQFWTKEENISLFIMPMALGKIYVIIFPIKVQGKKSSLTHALLIGFMTGTTDTRRKWLPVGGHRCKVKWMKCTFQETVLQKSCHYGILIGLDIYSKCQRFLNIFRLVLLGIWWNLTSNFKGLKDLYKVGPHMNPYSSQRNSLKGFTLGS